MAHALDRLRGSKAVRMLFSLALVAGLWPAASIAAPIPAYADESGSASVDVEGYVKAQADSGKVGEEKGGFLFWGGQQFRETGKYITVKHTYAQNLEDGDTIASIMTDADQCGEKVIAMYPSFERLYEVDGDAGYYVAFANGPQANGTAEPAVDFQAAIMNNLGMGVEGVEYDAETGLIYVPKSLYGYADIEAQGLQVQLLEPSSIDEGKKAEVEVSIDNQNGSVTVPEKVQTVEADAFDTDISFKIATADTASAISIDDIEVSADDGNVNYAKQTDGESKSASYDPSTGVLTVTAPPAATASLQVTIKRSGLGSLLAPQKAFAYDNPDEILTVQDFQFDDMDLDSMGIGEKFWYDATTYYYDTAGFNTSLRDYMLDSYYQYAYGGAVLDWHNNDSANWMGNGAVYGDEDNYYHYSGVWGDGYDDRTSCVLQVTMIDGWHTGDQGHTVDFSHSGDLWSSHGWSEQVGLYCAHVDVTGDGNGAPGSRPTFARVLAKGSDYVVLAFLTSQVYTQTGWAAYKFKVQSTGDLEVQKASANPEVTDGNPCYSLEGATFDVYNSDYDYVTTITTDSNGWGKAYGLKAGRYFLKETAAPKGYLVNSDWEAAGGSDWVTVPGGGTGYVTCADQPGNDPDGVLLQKVDAETGEKVAQGEASLALAEYTFEYYPGYYQTAEEAKASGEPERTWVMRTDSNGFIWLLDADSSFEFEGKTYPYKVSGDDFYREGSLITIPLGTVVAYETKAPEGYNLSDKAFVSRVVMDGSGNVATEGDQLAIDGNTGKPETVAAEQPKRGDLRFSKRDQGTMKKMAGVPFLVTSKTTGERHVLVTDANGQFDSSAFTSADSCNANDAALKGDEKSGFSVDESKLDASSGVWFGPEANRGAVGAFPYDEYSIEELPCSANEGKQLVHDGFAIWRDSATVDLGTIDDTTPIVATQAKNADTGEKSLSVAPKQTVLDAVSASSLVKGDSYTLETTLKDAADGKTLTLADGKASVSTEFQATSPSMSVKVEASLSTMNLSGHSVVACQKLYDSRGRLLATHENLADEAQTVKVVPPSIGTTAADGLDGDGLVIAMPGAKVVDTVAYSNVPVGNELTLSGEAHWADTGELAKDASGKAIAATAKFTPDASSGTAKVEFEFDATGFEPGRKLVFFEKLSLGDTQLASHEDKEDAAQTVTMTQPRLGTTAVDGFDSDKNVAAMPGAEVIDAVSYDNVAGGVEHELFAKLVYQDTGEQVVDAAGEPVQASMEFTPAASSGTVQVSLKFDGSNVDSDRKCVVQEFLYVSGKLIASHDDLSDVAQTVTLAPPRLSTQATDGQGGKNVVATAHAKVVDTVKYSGVRKGEAYTVSGKLMQPDGTPLLDAAGKEVTASKEFTAEAEFGEVSLVFEFDGSNLESDAEAVAFEKLFYSQAEIAKHEDPDDKDQTVGLLVPWASTTASDAASGGKTVAIDKDATVVDTVEFGNMPGDALSAHSILIDPDTGLPLLVGISDDDVAASYPADEVTTPGAPAEDTGDASIDGEAGHAKPTVAQWWASVLEALGAEQVETVTPGELIGYEVYDAASDSWAPLGGPDASSWFDGDTFVAELDGTTFRLTPNEGGSWTYSQSQAGSEVSASMPSSYVRALYTDDEVATKLVCRGEFDAQAAVEAFYAAPEYAAAAVVGSADIPAQATGSVDVSMPIDATGLDGRGAVVYELVTRDAGDGKAEALAIHADPDDFGQSVWFTKASIGTELVDATDGDHEALNSKSAKLTDTIRYDGLVKGKQYQAKGWLVDKSTGQPVFANDKKVEATATFVANDSSGTATVDFEFDASQLAGVDAVAFEELWLDTTLVAEHKDVDDESQTVKITETPKGGFYDKTGGSMAWAFALAGAMGAAGVGLMAMAARRARTRKAAPAAAEPAASPLDFL